MDTIKEKIFKGATRPAMKAGVPLLALLVFIPVILVGAWGAVLSGKPWVIAATFLIVIPAYVWMWMVTRKDDQRLFQMWLKLRLTLMNPNRGLWKARSYAPHQLGKDCK